MIWTAGGLAIAVVALLVLKPLRKADTATGVQPDTASVRGGGGPQVNTTRPDTAGGRTGGGVTTPVDGGVTKPEPPVALPVDHAAASAVGRVQLQPAQLVLEKGKAAPLVVQVFAPDGAPIRDGRPVTWSSSDLGVATVNRGVVRAVDAGRATITATVDGKTATTPITVKGAAEPVGVVAAISIDPEASTIPVGRSVTPVVQLRDARGAVLTGRLLSWSASDSSVISVSATGQVTGRSPGTANVIVSAEGQSRRATITVTAAPVAAVTVAPLSGPLKPGGTAQLVVTARDADGQVLANRKAGWATSDAKVVTVSDGLVTAHEAGTATITSTVDGRQGTVTITVLAPATPAPPALDPAAEQARAVQETTHLLDQFVAALGKKDLTRLKAVYPGMSTAAEQSWRTLLEDPRLKGIQASRDPLPALRHPDQESAEVPFILHLKPSYSGMQAPAVTIRYLATFREVEGKWQLLQLEEKK
jgi:uncharacterized protein YjdB